MECPICLRTDDCFTIETICNHKYCLECFLKLTNFLCPLCRKDMKVHLPNCIKNIILLNKAELDRNMNIVGDDNSIIDIDNLADFPFLS